MIEVQANDLTPEVLDILKQLKSLNVIDQIVITVDDKNIMVKINELKAAEIYGNELTIYTIDNVYHFKGTLKMLLQQLPTNYFIQVSKSSLINLNYLKSLEASFSGDMIAILSDNLKINISRRYVKTIKERLGI